MDGLVLGLRVLLSLAAVVGLLWFIQRRVSRHTTSRPGANLISVVTRQGISPKASVVVLDAAGKRFLLGVTEQNVSVLHTFDVEPTPEPAPAAIPGAAMVSSAIAPPILAASAVAQPILASSAAAPAVTTTAASLPGFPEREHAVAGNFAGHLRRERAAHADRSRPALAGSILSPTTWKQTAAAFRRGQGE